MVNVAASSDSIAVWVGLAGVVLGAAIAGGVELLRFHLGGQSDRKKELRTATVDLIGAANGFITLRGALSSPRALDDSLLGWIQAMSTQAERVQQASETIVRLGPDELAVAAERVAQAAVAAPVDVSAGVYSPEIENAVAAFQLIARGRGSSPGTGTQDADVPEG